MVRISQSFVLCFLSASVLLGQDAQSIRKGLFHETEPPRHEETLASRITDVVYHTLFAAGEDGWQENGSWERGTVEGGPDSGMADIVATGLAGGYGNSENALLTGPEIDLPTLTPGTRLMLMMHESFEVETGYDEGTVELSLDGGRTWIVVDSRSGRADWHESRTDLSRFAGERIRLGFRMRSDGSVSGAGWRIESLQIVRHIALAPRALTATMSSINALNFPFIFMNISVSKDGESISDLTKANFQVFEDNILQTDFFNVVPPASGGGVRLADVVFVFDDTSSMAGEITAAKDNVIAFVDALVARGVDFGLGLVTYKDNVTVRQGGTLTTNAEAFKSLIGSLSASGGGDFPENGFGAVQVALNSIAYRAGSQKIIVLITDAWSHDGREEDYIVPTPPTQAGLISAINGSGATLYAVAINTAQYVGEGSISEETGGGFFNVTSPFNEILDDIAGAVASTYVVSYRSSRPEPDGEEREVRVDISDGEESTTATGSYIPGEEPEISLTGATLALMSEGQALEEPLTISAEVVDEVEPDVETVTLFYKNTEDGLDGYAAAAMSSAGGDIYSAVVPGESVTEPGVDFYITASDGVITASDPETDPASNPYQIAVLPNEPPEIDHDPVTELVPEEPISIQATVKDETNELEKVELGYRKFGALSYTIVSMTNSGDDLYTAAIPGTAATEDGVEYYIRAEDDLELASFNGTPDSPHFIGPGEVKASNRVVIKGSDFGLFDVTVKATGEDGSSQTVQTNISGEYWFELDPGQYTFEAFPNKYGRGIRQKVAEVWTVDAEDPEFPLLEMGVVNRRQALGGQIGSLTNFGDPSIYGLSIPLVPNKPYRDEMLSAASFGNSFPLAPEATDERLYRLFLAMRANQQIASSAAGISGDFAGVIVDLAGTAASLGGLNAKLAGFLQGMLRRLGNITIARGLVSWTKLDLLVGKFTTKFSGLFDAVRNRIMDYMINSVDPSTNGAARVKKSLEILVANYVATQTSAKPEQIVKDKIANANASTELVKAMYADMTEEAIQATLTQAAGFVPTEDAIQVDQQAVQKHIVDARTKTVAAVNSTTTGNFAFILDVAGAIKNGMEIVSASLVPFLAFPPTAPVAIPATVLFNRTVKVLNLLELTLKTRNLYALTNTLFSELPREMERANASAFFDAGGEAAEEAASKNRPLPRAQVTQEAQAALATALTKFETELATTKTLVDEKDYVTLVDHVAEKLLPADDELEKAARLSEAVVQGAAFDGGSIDSNFKEDYIALGDKALASTASRLKLYFALMATIFEAAASESEDLDNEEYTSVKAMFDEAVTESRNKTVLFADDLSALRDEVASKGVVRPTAAVEKVALLEGDTALEEIDASPKTFTVKATISNVTNQPITNLKADLFSTGDDAGLSLPEDKSKTIESLPPGGKTEITWTTTYNGDFEKTTLPIGVGLESPSKGVHGGGAQTLSISLKDTRDADEDGMPDKYETDFGLDVSTFDSGDDPDDDGASNLAEMLLGSDPGKADTDGDGYKDGDEIEAGSDPLDAGKTPETIAMRATPKLSAIGPGSAIRGDSDVTVEINGANFMEGSRPEFGDGIEVLSVAVKSTTKIEATLAIDGDAPVGRRDVTVKNPVGISGIAAGAFEVHEVQKVPSNVILTWDPPATIGDRPRNLSTKTSAAGVAKRGHYGLGIPAPPRGSADEAASKRLPDRPLGTYVTIDEIEPNNTIDEAQVLQGTLPIVVNASADTADVNDVFIQYNAGQPDEIRDDIEDLYSVTILSPGLTVSLTDAVADMDLFVIEVVGDGLEIRGVSNDAGVADESIEIASLPAGTYLVAATVFDDAPGGDVPTDYTLTVEGDIEGGAGVTPTAYHVYRSMTPNASSSGSRIATTSGAAGWYVDLVDGGETYYYEVTAVFDGAESNASNENLVDVETPNRVPLVWNRIPDVTLLLNGEDYRREVPGAMPLFRDLDGDVLLYEISSSDLAVVQATLEGNVVNLEATSLGSADVSLSASDGNGGWASMTFRADVPAAVASETEERVLPDKYALYGNYPNPFNPTTKIPFDVVETGHVRMDVFDVIGRRVVTLVDRSLSPGQYTANFDGAGLPSGVYLYRIEMGEFVAVKKMLLVK